MRVPNLRHGVLCLSFLAAMAVASESRSQDAAQTHPLLEVLSFAKKQHAEIKQSVRDYECLIIKRERIDGRLQVHQYMAAKVRSGSKNQPFAAYMRFLRPNKVAGREVQYVEGENDGKLLVRRRRGGVTLQFEPDTPLVLEQSSIPITDLNFETMLAETVARIEADMKADPSGENTDVEIFREAKINKRNVTAVKITHQQQQPGLEFHQAVMYIDHEWKIPTRLEVYHWPREAEGKPVLMSEFTFLNLKVNVNHPDSAFHVLVPPVRDDE